MDVSNMKCKKCGKEFTVEVLSMNVPGCLEKEEIICPYCGKINGGCMTSCFVKTYKINK